MMERLTRNRGFNLETLTDFSKLDVPTKKHLKNVYSVLAMSMFAAAAGGAVHMFTQFLKGGFLSAIAGIGLLLLLLVTPYNGKNQTKRIGILMSFAFCTGLGLGPIMEGVTQIDSSIVPTAFFFTTLIFVCFSLSALLAEERSYLYMGGLLGSGLTILLVSSILNLFMRSYFLYQVHLYLGLVVFSAFILYDTQLIVEKFRRGDKDYVWHCLDLFIDFIAVFRRIMVILAQNKENKRKK
ncbi:bax inhibitor 1-like [Dendronephthya gigantea]|uniref:bax inhibitor 1-like n=1 Tax=Dendronephthya gigantea TaxID=151771 RepID=UPI001069D7F8|nr:bax inhibitor 1-like [Dendronephthya gigantea]